MTNPSDEMRHHVIILLAASASLFLLQPISAQDLCLMDEAAPTQSSTPFTGVVKVPVFVHVITRNDGTTGAVPESVIDEQIAVLNSEFSQVDMVFELAGTSSTANDDWFFGVNVSASDPERIAMQSTLSVDAARVINIYTLNHDIEGAQAMGFSHFPWRDVETDFKHGLVLD